MKRKEIPASYIALRRQALGEVLRRRREAKNYTLVNLSEKSGLAERNIKRIEDGKMSVELDFITRLCACLDLEFSIQLKDATHPS